MLHALSSRFVSLGKEVFRPQDAGSDPINGTLKKCNVVRAGKEPMLAHASGRLPARAQTDWPSACPCETSWSPICQSKVTCLRRLQRPSPLQGSGVLLSICQEMRQYAVPHASLVLHSNVTMKTEFAAKNAYQ